MRVLIVEDEERLAQNVAAILRDNALCAVDIAPDGEEGLFQACSTPYDLLVLDLMLPRLTGLQLLKRFRGEGRNSPVLVLTARDEKEFVVRLLNAGADDYLTKPFDLGEFVARCKALLRRGKGEHSPVIRAGPLEIETVRRMVRVRGKRILLTAMEYRVLECLALRRGALVSKEELLEHLYDFNWERFGNVIEVYISGLRRKLEGAAGERLIQTVRGLGYTLCRDDSPTATGSEADEIEYPR
ncbi:MAG TPA: response regulator transcription factor [Terracidiphilus sp.]|jgi:two-component system response regulator PhoP|nr:response regulator transcription factor [Terracidiphilus sp.]